MSDRTPAPVARKPAPPSALTRSRTLWLLSFLAGLTAVVFAFLGREKHLASIAEQVRAVAPGRAASTVDTASQVVLFGTMIAIAVVIVAESLLVRRMMARRGGARVGLLILLAVHLLVALVAGAYLTLPGEDGLRDRVMLIAWVALAALAYAVSLAPSVGRWYRTR